jgi:hypothetical protein
MKRYLAILALLPLLAMGGRQQGMGPGPGMPASAGGGGHAMTPVHTYSCGSTANFAGTTTCTITATTTGNSVLYAYSIDGGAAPTLISPTCTNLAQGIDTGANYDGWCLISNITPGTTSITLTYSSNYTVSSIFVAEVSGLVTSSAIDQNTAITLYDSSVTGSATNVTGAVTPTNANDAICGFVDNRTNTYTAGTLYTMLGTVNYSGTSSVAIDCRNVVGTSGTYNPGMTYLNNGVYSDVATAALKLQ